MVGRAPAPVRAGRDAGPREGLRKGDPGKGRSRQLAYRYYPVHFGLSGGLPDYPADDERVGGGVRGTPS